jgi:hypothetical protein
MSTTADVSGEERQSGRNWTVSSLLLLTFGLILVIVGGYFWFVRPPLLPEDLGFLATSPTEIDAAAPKLKVWLAHVFRVLGGYIVSCGILTIALATTSYREHRAAAVVAAGAAGAASIGLMTAVNFSINSDFRWILSGIALLWAFSIISYGIEALRSRPRFLGTSRGYEARYSQSVLLRGSARDVFAFADDFSNLSSHMGKSSMMMMGSSMKFSFDERRGQAVGSRVTMTGRILGLDLSLEEIVRLREPPRRKEWETIGRPRLLVIGSYRLGFEIASVGEHSKLRMSIDYNLPSAPLQRMLGIMFGGTYAKWCIRSMVNASRLEFGEVENC